MKPVTFPQFFFLILKPKSNHSESHLKPHIIKPPDTFALVPHWPAPIVWELLLCEVAQLVSTSSNEERSLPVEWDLASPYQRLHVVSRYLTSILSEHSADPRYWLLLGHLGCGSAHWIIESETDMLHINLRLYI